MNTEMNYPCPLKSDETIEVLMDYTARTLDAVQSGLLERHMDQCLNCATFRDDQAAVWQALDAWEPAPVSMDFNRRLWQRIGEDQAAPWYTKIGFRNLGLQIRGSAWKPALSVAAAVLVVATGFVLDHSGTRTGSPTTAVESRVTITEADQVERTLDDIQLLHQFDTAADGEPASRTM